MARKITTPGVGCASRVTHERCEMIGTRDAPEHHALGQRELANQHREREHAGDEHPLEDAESQHRSDCHERDQELGFADAEEVGEARRL